MKKEDEMKSALLAFKARFHSSPAQIVLPEGRKFHFFKTSDIMYLQGDYNNVKLYLSDGDMKVIRGRLERIVKLFDGHGFLRIQVSYLVNGRYVFELDEKQVVLKDGIAFKISPKYQKEILEQLRIF